MCQVQYLLQDLHKFQRQFLKQSPFLPDNFLILATAPSISRQAHGGEEAHIKVQSPSTSEQGPFVHISNLSLPTWPGDRNLATFQEWHELSEILYRETLSDPKEFVLMAASSHLGFFFFFFLRMNCDHIIPWIINAGSKSLNMFMVFKLHHPVSLQPTRHAHSECVNPHSETSFAQLPIL